MTHNIQNVSYHDIKNGNFNHPTEDNEAILIQIVDPCVDFPKPKCEYPFKQIFQFEFSDVEDELDIVWPFRVRISQVEEIVKVLLFAFEMKYDVVVHCIAGVSRSGAVVQFATEWVGFKECHLYRNPNEYMLRMLKTFFKYRLG